jgi:hypothetical protein
MTSQVLPQMSEMSAISEYTIVALGADFCVSSVVTAPEHDTTPACESDFRVIPFADVAGREVVLGRFVGRRFGLYGRRRAL